jgi:glycerol-3-phosphate cytidylyltransferase
MKTILTYGTFDLFHVGHVRLLRRLSAMGDRLVIGLSTDEFNEGKGKKTIISYEQRREILLSCKYVDDVFAEENWQQKRDDILREKADILAMGDDWAGKFDDLGDVTNVIYLPRTEDISTTEVKQMVSYIKQDKKAEIMNAINTLMAKIETL